ncbi:protein BRASSINOSTEROID INSENSITIVE 1-like isoform X2 [Carya illinoinensis]|uniref:protein BRASSINOSTEROID INSENSITIVE 1-like isoform X2 n=1 Tax=Carya illinoinensis TaxID=32201 RepID=UPI001C721F1D|nr:protein BRASSINOSTEROID INSENSITIVE 1-like isoform X2 [Carya illinoinensis]
MKILDMSGNRFTGSISPYIGALSLTKDILLSDNNFNGAFPTEDLCRSKKLEELDISGINNMSSLRVLDISGNRYIGNCFTNICSE